MALVKNFTAETGPSNTVSLNWDQPLGFNDTTDELIVTRTITHFPVELFNADFPNRATDPRPIEIFRGKTLIGLNEPIPGKSTSFNGTDEYAEITSPSAALTTGITTQICVSAWIKMSSLPSILGTIVAQWETAPSTRQKWYMGMDFNGNLRFIVDQEGFNANRVIYRNTTALLTNQWYHVAATFDGGTGTCQIYIDGVPVTTVIQAQNGSVPTSLDNNSADVTVGYFSSASAFSDIAFAGNLDEISVWNSALNSTQVAEIYNSGTPIDLNSHSASANLVSWWTMGDGDTSPTITDNTGSDDLTMVNMDDTNFVADSLGGITGFSISVAGNILTDLNANFPNVKGRLLRDANGQVFRILESTVTTLTLSGEPVADKYVILPDFPTVERPQENYEFDIRTTSGLGYIKDLVVLENGTLTLKNFTPGELANFIFLDAGGNKFIVKDNTEDTVFFFESTETPQVGVGMIMLNNFYESQPLPYVDNFRTEQEALVREGTQLLNNRFYYYTIFTKPEGVNVAQAEFATTDSGVSTQDFAISTDNTKMSTLLYNLWPSLDRELDASGDLEDLMKVFGFQLNEVHALVDTYNLQDPDNVLVTALLPLSEQTGLPSVGFSIGADTLRRIARDMISCWKLKGSKEGIAIFIRKITTWDVTNGTADFSGAIQDFLPNVEALRFYDPNLGSLNTRLTQTDPFVGGGRFARSLPGIVIPGFFTFREFVVDIPNVALYVGVSESFTPGTSETTLIDTSANFGATDSLVGNFLLPNAEEVNDIFEIIGNTATTITVRGTINNKNPGGNYAVLSPLNTNRFQILNKLLPVYIPFGTRAGFRFIIV